MFSEINSAQQGLSEPKLWIICTHHISWPQLISVFFICCDGWLVWTSLERAWLLRNTSGWGWRCTRPPSGWRWSWFPRWWWWLGPPRWWRWMRLPHLWSFVTLDDEFIIAGKNKQKDAEIGKNNTQLLDGLLYNKHLFFIQTWRRHQMESFSALLALCAGNSPVNSPHKDQWRRPWRFLWSVLE